MCQVKTEERTSCARNAATGTLRKRGELRTTAAAQHVKAHVGRAAAVRCDAIGRENIKSANVKF